VTVLVKTCYSLDMTELPSAVQARRAVEDQAIQLAEERREIESREVANIEAAVDLIPRAAEANMPLDHLARLIGVSRQTLYRWQEVARRLNDPGT
jgi:transcriptional regulator GlxA family with amidase domain